MRVAASEPHELQHGQDLRLLADLVVLRGALRLADADLVVRFVPLVLRAVPVDFEVRFALVLRAPARPEPDFLPPPSCLFTVAQARASATSSDTPSFL